MSITITVAFFVFGLLGMPIAFALGFGSLVGLWIAGVDANMLPQRMLHAVNSFPLMSIPFFMLAGELMIKADIMARLIDFANAFVGRVRGGMGTRPWWRRPGSRPSPARRWRTPARCPAR